VGNRRLLAATFDAITRRWRQADLLAAMEAAGVPAGPIYDLKQVFDDPQAQHRGLATEVPHPLAGSVRIHTNPIKFSDTPITDYVAPPTLGQHNDEIYRGLLGLDAEELEHLKSKGIV
jgi:crotonobetainyl-CoA:carnitine CoA-transferase CaiB-like acyl-CoA transferase